MSSIGNNVYTGLAIYGKINVIIGAIFAGIIVLVLLMIGISLVFSKNVDTNIVSGIVSNVNNQSYSISYKVGGILYTTNGFGTNLTNGQSVNVLYDPSNPTNSRLSTSMSKRAGGFMLIGVALVIGIISGAMVYFTLKYKQVAAIEGGLDAANQITNLI